MYILGLSAFFHDSSACLLKDGKLLSAVEEERFTRKKHDMGFPFKAVDYCLKNAGITIDDIDYVAFYEKPLLKFERVMSQFIHTFPKGLVAFNKSMPSWINEKLAVRKMIRKKLKFKKDIFFIKHHLVHAASSYLVSPFDKAAVCTIDGVGEWSTTTCGYAKGSEILLKKEINFPHSLGLLYSTVTGYLGFSVNNSEYKVMGLSAYGKPIYYDALKKIIDVNDDGSFKLDMSYFVYPHKMSMPSKRFIEEFGPMRKKEHPVEQRHKDLAASLQKVTEEVVINILNNLHKETKCDNLCMAGGVALNSVANGKIIKNTPFKKIFIQPSAGDGGSSVGAAFYAYNTILGKPRSYVMDNAYLGPSFTNEEIESFLKLNDVKYRTFKDEKESVRHVARLIYDNKIVGWFHGRMEFGPRALGSRSILANPCNDKMRDIINAKVKHRELFRPFAPVVCEEDAYEYFECDRPLPKPADFMLMVYPIKKNKQSKIPAVTHVDGTGRLQVIRRTDNYLYYDLIQEFSKLSGVPILINTSFNIRGEPIVCTPEHAYRCMMGTGIDYLAIGKFLIKREDNPQHMWDSEKYAKD